MKEIHKSRDGKLLFGICAGLGKKCGISAWVFRAIFIVGLLAMCASIWVYILLYFMMADYE